MAIQENSRETGKRKTLQERIAELEFQPEVYIYPTPRVYKPLDFQLNAADFGNELNIYVHIPFCRQICSFCGYLKIAGSDENLKADYVNAVIKEINMYSRILKGKTIKTLHFGGGTPSLLSVSQLARLIDALVEANPRILETCEEVSIEATPESVEQGKFENYKELGINRVSIGVQTLNNAEIALSRRHNLADFSIRAIETLRKAGIPNIVADLMIGIEHQTPESFEASARGLIQLMPETVELYALGLMPQTALGKQHHNLMGNKEIYLCYDIGRILFLEAGYKQDCHNRYAIPNRGSFLQEDYVFHGMSLIGFGAGARSYAGNMHYRNAYNSTSPKTAVAEYMQMINGGGLSVESGIYLSDDEKMRQYAIGHIEALDKKEFEQRFGLSFGNAFPDLHSNLLRLGLAAEDKERLVLTTKGLNFRDLICTELFSKDVTAAEGTYRPRRNG
ncbi:MAG TPA: coproporphyrinogen III oxidase family protein [Nanoarchaeota archaeon]|nr:coproporphyrinogen III oxidase family protein [Nanoarchaeota archaeon]